MWLLDCVLPYGDGSLCAHDTHAGRCVKLYCVCVCVLQMQTSASTSSEAMTELYQQSRQLRVLFQRIDQMEVSLCSADCGCDCMVLHGVDTGRWELGLRQTAVEGRPLWVGVVCLAATLLPHPLSLQSFVQAISHSVGVMEEYMEQSEKQLEPSQLRRVLRALPSFLRVCVRPASTSGATTCPHCDSSTLRVLCNEPPPPTHTCASTSLSLPLLQPAKASQSLPSSRSPLPFDPPQVLKSDDYFEQPQTGDLDSPTSP